MGNHNKFFSIVLLLMTLSMVAGQEQSALLHDLVHRNNTAGLRSLLAQASVDVDTRNRCGRTALYGAAARGEEHVVSILLENGADADVQDGDGKVALHAAVAKGNTGVVQLLLHAGADLDLPDFSQETALSRAITSGRLQMAQLFLERGAVAEPGLLQCLEAGLRAQAVNTQMHYAMAVRDYMGRLYAIRTDLPHVIVRLIERFVVLDAPIAWVDQLQNTI